MKVCPLCSREYGDEHGICTADGVALVLLDTGAGDRGENLLGQVVGGRYRLERIVGRGGMGTVYACQHVVVGKTFAMKVLRPGIERSEEILQRFIREAQAANAIGSRHICEVSDFGQLSGGAFYVVMELLEGVSLTRALRDRRLSPAELRRVFIQIADTLQRAHEQGIIHRDLKPDNVLLVQDGGDPHFVKLLDFGIAKIMQSQASSLTETGVILGTPYYMSPEQARGDAVDHRSDIYALGVMMYRAFTGRLPFVADTAMGVLTRHLTEIPEPPSKLADVESTTERVILRCMEKKPVDRFPAIADISEALQTVIDSPTRSNDRATVDDHDGRDLRAALDERLSAEGLSTTSGGESWGSAPTPYSPRPGSMAAVQASAPPPVMAPHPQSAPVAVVAAGAHLTTDPMAPAGAVGVGLGAAGTPLHAPAPASLPPPGMGLPESTPAHLSVEAFTHRGVVSNPMTPLPQRSSPRRVVLWTVVMTAMVAMGGVSALVLLRTPSGSAAPSGSGAPSAGAAVFPASESGGAGGSAPEDPSESDPAADGSASDLDETDAAAPPRRVPGPRRPPPPKPSGDPDTDPEFKPPEPEIRNPFDE